MLRIHKTGADNNGSSNKRQRECQCLVSGAQGLDLSRVSVCTEFTKLVLYSAIDTIASASFVNSVHTAHSRVLQTRSLVHVPLPLLTRTIASTSFVNSVHTAHSSPPNPVH